MAVVVLYRVAFFLPLFTGRFDLRVLRALREVRLIAAGQTDRVATAEL